MTQPIDHIPPGISWFLAINAALCCFIAGSIITCIILSIAFPYKITKKEALDLHYPKR